MENKILNDLEQLGLGALGKLDIFSTEKDDQLKRQQEENAKAKEKEKTELDYLFQKSYTCPVCGTNFKALRVKASKPKLLSTDPDMRPVYQYLDVNKYDCVACERCGYAALASHFDEISDSQVKTIRNEIAKNFKGIRPAEEKYTYDEAILRYQLALANAVVKRTKISERAYICLKLAWLYRGKRNELVAPEEARIKELSHAETQYIQKALEGFRTARAKETFPIAGMDEWTFDFLLAELMIEVHEYDEAKRMASSIVLSRNVPTRVKEKARELRDYINDLETDV
jgi:uncharacterized protein (DUF2225 family)